MINLRLYQSSALTDAETALKTIPAAVVILPTGAGKTVIASAFILSVLQGNEDATFLFLQHTDALLSQNSKKVAKMTGLPCSIVQGNMNDFSGTVIFASVMTLAKDKRLTQLPAVTHLIVDECHHAAANSWATIIRHCRKINPDLKAFSMTATEERGDGKPLLSELGPVVHKVFIRELVDLGYLVPMRSLSVNVGDSMAQIAGLDIENDELEQGKVAAILNTPMFNDAVVRQWLKEANGRQTVAYCTTIEHAQAVAQAFRDYGISAAALDSRDKKARDAAIEAFRAGEIMVLTNCMMLTEGFDHPPTSCIIVLRAMLHVSTFVQALGRALRMVDPEEFPEVIKTDALCLDFSGAATRHAMLDEKTRMTVEDVNLTKDGDEIPEEPEFEDESEFGIGLAANDNFDFIPTMNENTLAIGDLKWIRYCENDEALVASGFNCAAFLIAEGDQWLAFGRKHKGPLLALNTGSARTAFDSACEFLRSNEASNDVRRDRSWMNLDPTDAQETQLKRMQFDNEYIYDLNRYEASCHLSFAYAEDMILEAMKPLELAA